MKTTLNWLREFAALPDDAAAIAEALLALGHEVEGIETKAAQFDGVVVGTVQAVFPHPDADRLRVADVDLGAGTQRVVCGAWNFEAGAVVALAVPGSTLAGGLEVGLKTIRGVESAGMIASSRELGLGDDHEGILLLDSSFAVGDELGPQLPLPDVVFDLHTTTNRPDALGTLGLARDLAAHFEVPFSVPTYEPPEIGPPSRARVRIEDPQGCMRFTAREVRNVTVAPSPLWLRLRLEWCGIRAINNVVDATNYAMLELGHPTHAFDMDRLGEQVVVRRATAGERMTTLDGIARELDERDLVIADGRRPVGFAGVMGGENTEVHAGTTRVLVEVAYFDPPTVLLTGARHGLRTEASLRFERGMDPDGPLRASARVADLLVAHAGGEVAPGFIDEYPTPHEQRRLELATSEISRVLGIEIPAATVVDYLRRLGFEVSGDDPLQVVVPTHRSDVNRPVHLLEEIARLHGYERFPSSVATGTGGGLPPAEARRRRIAAVLMGAGYHEVINYSFLGQQHLDDLGLDTDDPRRRGIEVANPLSAEEGVLRTTLLPGLLRSAGRNVSRRVDDVALFELGAVFLPGDGALPQQPEHLGWLVAGGSGESWEGPGRPVDVYDVLGVWQVLADDLGITAEIRPASPPALHPGRAAEIMVAGSVIGFAGELHPRVAARFGLGGRVGVAEMDITALGDFTPERAVVPVASYPPVLFDMAFDVPASEPAGAVLATVEQAGGDLLEAVVLFDVFTGKPLAAGRKSLAFRLTVRAPDRTLTDEEMAPLRDGIAAAVAAAHDGVLRGG